jgi:hypothetical protein
MSELLSAVSRRFESVVIVVNGLDEIAGPEERGIVLELLSSLNTSKYGIIKCIYTSRDEIDIREHFEQFESIFIAARKNDLELYVAAVIETRIHNSTLRMEDPSLKETIVNGIVTKANGMYDRHQLSSYMNCTQSRSRLPTNRCSTDKERRKTLETLPLDLFETYRRILASVSKRTRGSSVW